MAQRRLHDNGPIQQGYSLLKSTNDTALQLAMKQRQDLMNSVQRFGQLQTAAGTNQLMSYGNQIAAEQAQQLMQMRLVATQMLEAQATRSAAGADRQALSDAATQQALVNKNGGFEGAKSLPVDYPTN